MRCSGCSFSFSQAFSSVVTCSQLWRCSFSMNVRSIHRLNVRFPYVLDEAQEMGMLQNDVYYSILFTRVSWVEKRLKNEPKLAVLITTREFPATPRVPNCSGNMRQNASF